MADTTSTSQVQAGGPLLRLAMLKVLPVGGARAATVILDEPELAIGREGTVAGPLALADTEVSRRHAIIARDGAAWTVADSGSRNGTFVNGARVERARLEHGGLVRVGRTLLLYLELEVRANESFAPASPRILGSSAAVLRLHAEIALVAAHAVPVLILGESGVGKELVAEELHRLSGRKGAFVPVNCAAIAESLAESELFGHVSGAFTGARGASGGLFAAADGGTLFLDEIGEMALDLQAKLLRALAKGEVRPVGGSSATRVDVRVVAATNRDLGDAVAREAFRGDLFARLTGWTLRVPPLRERREDIVALAAAFLAQKGAPPLSVDAAEALLLHRWPFNVRELEQTMAAAALRAGGAAEVTLEHLPVELAQPVAARAPAAAPAAAEAGEPPLDLLVSRENVPSRDDLVAALRRLDGNVARVAEFFGKERNQVYRWAKRYGLDLESYRKP
jgi:sigma-54 dependent transcriptional regulator, acetoin dehydrogenase operon transcriptional activator AcoR